MKRWRADPLSEGEQGDIEAKLQQSFSRRIFLSAALVFAGFLGLFVRMGYLQVLRYDYYRTRSQSNRMRLKAIVPERGTIFDRKGRALTENILRYRVIISPSQTVNVRETVDAVDEILPLLPEERERFFRLYKQTRRYESAVLKASISEQDYYRLAVQLYRLPGVSVEEYYERYYPYGELAAHVIGYTNRISEEDLETLNPDDYRGLQYIGRSGIEQQYEERLRGKPGYQQVETDANGNIVRLMREQPAVRGQDIYLSLDIELQAFIYRALGDYRGSSVMIDPQTGEVLAMVSKPGFDANLFARGISQRQYKRLQEDPHGPMYDRALKGRYPPGSVIKPFMSLAGYHYGVFTPYTRVNCPGYFRVPGPARRFHCWNRHGHGSVNADRAMAQSCDVYYYHLGYQLGIERIAEFASHFRLGIPTGIDMPDEGSGVVPTREWKQKRFKTQWYIGDTINCSIGQGFFTTTPLQLAYMTALIARDGSEFTPRLLRKVYDPESATAVELKAPLATGKVAVYEPGIWNTVRQDMMNVIHSTYGTARNISRGLTYRMAGKSGTVQVVSFKTERRVHAHELGAEEQDNAMFIAFAPADKPKLAISMVVERGGGGSSTAAPLVRQISDYYLQGMNHVADA